MSCSTSMWYVWFPPIWVVPSLELLDQPAKPPSQLFCSITKLSDNVKVKIQDIVSKLIFKLTKVHEVLQFIYLRMWQSPGVSELQVSVNVTAAELGA